MVYLIDKYNLVKNQYTIEENSSKITELENKYQQFVPFGWYGIDLPYNIPSVWLEVLEEIIKECLKYPAFKLLQCKVKYGSLNLYTTGLPDSVLIELDEVLSKLHDNKMVY